jgi:hypothetical protein
MNKYISIWSSPYEQKHINIFDEKEIHLLSEEGITLPDPQCLFSINLDDLNWTEQQKLDFISYMLETSKEFEDIEDDE